MKRKESNLLICRWAKTKSQKFLVFSGKEREEKQSLFPVSHFNHVEEERTQHKIVKN